MTSITLGQKIEQKKTDLTAIAPFGQKSVRFYSPPPVI